MSLASVNGSGAGYQRRTAATAERTHLLEVLDLHATLERGDPEHTEEVVGSIRMLVDATVERGRRVLAEPGANDMETARVLAVRLRQCMSNGRTEQVRRTR